MHESTFFSYSFTEVEPGDVIILATGHINNQSLDSDNSTQ